MITLEYFSISFNTIIEVRLTIKKKWTDGNCIFFEKKVKTQCQKCFFFDNCGNRLM